MSLPELSLKQVNRFHLRSHFLLNNAKTADLLEVVDQVCGLNAQTARAPFISLWSRIKDFRKNQLEKSLYQDKTLVKTWLMRGTVHIIPTQDFIVYQKALGRSLVEGWQLTLQRLKMGFSGQKKTKLCQKILDLLTHASLTKKELLSEVRHLLKDFPEKEQKIILSRTLRELSYQGFICHAEPTGPWYHFKENRFTNVERWVSKIDLNKIGETEAKGKLFLKYLHGYGPASIQDFAYWSGLKVTESSKIYQKVKNELTEIKIKDTKGSFWILKKDWDELNDINIKQKPPIRFLPEFDPLIMGHKDKSRILNEKHRKKVFLPLAGVAPTIVFNGQVAGTWDFKMSTNSFTTFPFEQIGSKEQKEIKLGSARLKQFLDSDQKSLFRRDNRRRE